jgi:hypothetical protein
MSSKSMKPYTKQTHDVLKISILQALHHGLNMEIQTLF